ncbi:phenylalanine--tRNA ligase subunit alpha [Desulfurococcaceae archaeon MEX13E-LK6-19]|nr:phenylalanine--tRNA ligase subunit alpha [Desulfurococcaceae archaeon MEX13E-LK6-19]
MGVNSLEKITVTPRQYKIIEELVDKTDFVELSAVARKIGLRIEDLMRDLAELEAKELVVISRKTIEKIVLTDEAKFVLEKGFPEEIVYRAVEKCVGKRVDEFIDCVVRETGIDKEHATIGFQYLVKGKCLRVINGLVEYSSQQECVNIIENAGFLKSVLKNILAGGKASPDIIKVLKRRKMVTVEKSSVVLVKPTDKLKNLWSKKAIEKAELVTVVTPELVEKGLFDKIMIKEFDLSVTPPRMRIARKNPYMEFLDLAREILVSMGFEEVKGPHVELEFWNFDALFQAQDHPAREIHDTFFLETSFRGKVVEELLERARRIHEKGWKYKWSVDKALTPVLRTQTTAVSARIIYERGPGEYRCFTIDRVFRPETLDAKHAMEFYQLDGIIVGKNVSFKDLLAFFREFAAALGIKEIWFKPGYFPFTEPSVEGFIKHPKLGWVEVFPGGVFRPEVMEILGAGSVRAVAWGIGIDRVAMTVLGIEDIRDLFSPDLDFLEKLRTPTLPYFLRKTSAQEVKVVKAPF